MPQESGRRERWGVMMRAPILMNQPNIFSYRRGPVAFLEPKRERLGVLPPLYPSAAGNNCFDRLLLSNPASKIQ